MPLYTRIWYFVIAFDLEELFLIWHDVDIGDKARAAFNINHF